MTRSDYRNAPQLPGKQPPRTGSEPRLTGAAALPGLLRGLSNPNPGARMRALDLLLEQGAEACPALLNAMSSPDARVRYLAAMGLGRVGNIDVVPALLAGLADESENVGMACVESLGQLGKAGVLDAGTRGQVADALLAKLAQPGLTDTRCALLCDTLGRVGDVRAVTALIRLVENGSARQRIASAGALGHIGHHGALPALRRAARDPHALVAQAACEALSIIQT